MSQYPVTLESRNLLLEQTKLAELTGNFVVHFQCFPCAVGTPHDLIYTITQW